jgi:transposase
MTLIKEQNSLRRRGSNGNYDPLFIKEVVAEVEDGKALVDVCDKHNLSKGTLINWLRHYSSPAYRQNRKKPFSMQVRRSILRSVEDGSMTIAEVQSAYNIKAKSTIKRWMTLEKQENDDLSACNSSVVNKTNKPDTAPVQPTPEEMADLQQQLADARLKIAALNTLIDVAEEQLKINIRKKPGAKQC